MRTLLAVLVVVLGLTMATASLNAPEDPTLAVRDGVTHHVTCDTFVNCAGPMVGEVAQLAGVALPVSSEAHY
jgi:glycine/D-amino acid oxidase-like deaminating enzyme